MVQPQFILIYCEGKTEKLYFEIVKKRRRVSSVNIEIFSEKGQRQHYNLVDKCANEKNGLISSGDFVEDEVEVWAVCDRDAFGDSFTKLKKYADQRGVMLAFSDPQFEIYLIQHFRADNTRLKGKPLENKLSDILKKEGYQPYKKTNLKDLDDWIKKYPKKLEFAISNSDCFKKHTKKPFLTVQHLTRKILEFELK